MAFGSQTVTFVTVTAGALDRNNIATLVRTEVPVEGCHFRAMKVEEKLGLANVATEVWICTAPPDSAVLAAEAVDELKYNGETYQLVGAIQPKYDLKSPDVHHVVVLAQRQAA